MSLLSLRCATNAADFLSDDDVWFSLLSSALGFLGGTLGSSSPSAVVTQSAPRLWAPQTATGSEPSNSQASNVALSLSFQNSQSFFPLKIPAVATLPSVDSDDSKFGEFAGFDGFAGFEVRHSAKHCFSFPNPENPSHSA